MYRSHHHHHHQRFIVIITINIIIIQRKDIQVKTETRKEMLRHKGSCHPPEGQEVHRVAAISRLEEFDQLKI